MTTQVEEHTNPNDVVERLGRRIRAVRKGQSTTVQELADRSGVSRRLLTQIELGQANPSVATVERIAKALGVDFSAIASHRDNDITAAVVDHRTPLLEYARRMMVIQTTQRADTAEATQLDPAARLRTVLLSALPLDDVRLEEARVWLGFAAASIAEPTLQAIHEDGNRNWLARITRLLADASATSSTEGTVELAAGLVALVEGLGSLAALDPATYTQERLTRVLNTAVDAALERARQPEGTPA